MKKLLAFLITFATLVGMLVFFYLEDVKFDKALVEFIKSNDNFKQEDIDMLWHHRNDGWCSPEFREIYDIKIKPL